MSKASNIDAETYSGKTLISISKDTEYTPGEVLDQLLTITDSDILYAASNLKEIRQKLKEQEDEFIIQGEFNSIS